MKTEEVVKKSASQVVTFGAGTLGLLGGGFLLGKIPAFGPPILQKIFPGTVGMILAFLVVKKFGGKDKEYINAIAFGLGLASFATAVNSLTSGSAGTDTIAGKINKATALPRLGYVQNYGNYPPEHFMYRSGNESLPLSMNGLRGLRGADSDAWKLQGTGDANAWKLNGY